MKTKLITALLILLAFQTLNAQVNQEWDARYNGPGNNTDNATSIAVDGSGNVYVTGYSSGANYDYATIKYNSSGAQEWAARYSGPGGYTDWAFSIVVDGSGNVYVTGESYGSGTNSDYATIKYNSSGVQQWAARYNGPGNYTDRASSIAVDGSGNVYVTGWSFGFGTSYDYATIKYSASGVLQWVVRYDGPVVYGEDRAYSIALDGSGNVYVTGGSESGSDYDYATIKYNSSGIQQWVARYDGMGGGSDTAFSIKVNSSGNVYVTGRTYGYGTNSDYTTIKYNSSGVQQWLANYNGPANGNDGASSIAVDGFGNVYVTGESASGSMTADFATIKYNSLGLFQWVKRYNGPGNGTDRASSVAVDGSGNVYVTGDSRSGGSGTEDYATIKYNSAGDQQWVQRYNGPGNSEDRALSIALDGINNVYVTGRSTGSGTGFDYATIKYSQLTGIQPVSNETPDRFSLYQNYPNPFNPTTNIKFQIPNSGYVLLKIYDNLGREVSTLVNEQLNPGTYEVNWNASQFSSGIYYYRLSSGEYIETKKMMLVK